MVSCRLKVADNERRNVNFPDCPLSFNLSPNFLRTAFTFQKINPSREGFGDITVEIWVKGPKTRQIPAPI